jgi:hypothetical protein
VQVELLVEVQKQQHKGSSSSRGTQMAVLGKHRAGIKAAAAMLLGLEDSHRGMVVLLLAVGRPLTEPQTETLAAAAAAAAAEVEMYGEVGRQQGTELDQEGEQQHQRDKGHAQQPAAATAAGIRLQTVQ